MWVYSGKKHRGRQTPVPKSERKDSANTESTENQSFSRTNSNQLDDGLFTFYGKSSNNKMNYNNIQLPPIK